MPLPFFNGRYQIFSSTATGSADYQTTGLFFDETSNFNASDIEVGDFIVDANGWLYEIALIDNISPVVLDLIDTEAHGAPFNGAGVVTRRTTNNRLYVPTRISNSITEFLKEHIRNISLSNTDDIGNKTIQGLSGFASHELDGSNNDVNSFIEWDSTDNTHYHRVEPKVDTQDLDIKIGFQFPSTFSSLVESGTALEFYAKADDGSTAGVNLITLTHLVDSDGTEYAVSGKEVSAASRTAIAMTKAEVDAVLNPTSSSSSSASTVSWDSADAGKVIYARFKLSGNILDKIYLDQDNAFMYLA
jgi:hypothetical protein